MEPLPQTNSADLLVLFSVNDFYKKIWRDFYRIFLCNVSSNDSCIALGELEHQTLGRLRPAQQTSKPVYYIVDCRIFECNFKLALVPLCQLESTAHLNVIGNPLHCFWHSQELQISMAIHQLDESICAVIYQLDSEKLKNLTFPISSFWLFAHQKNYLKNYFENCLDIYSSTLCVCVVFQKPVHVVQISTFHFYMSQKRIQTVSFKEIKHLELIQEIWLCVEKNRFIQVSVKKIKKIKPWTIR